MKFDQLRQWAQALGFASVGLAKTDLANYEPYVKAWLEAGFHGDMNYMSRGLSTRIDPSQLVPQACTAIMVTMNYAPASDSWLTEAQAQLTQPGQAYVARYAWGRDYHKVIRNRLQKLMDQITTAIGPLGYRVFCDSAPIQEVELARRAQLGWRGKHSLLLSREQGSMFFIGTVLTDYAFESIETAEGSALKVHDVAVPVQSSEGVGDPLNQQHSHCGSCSACIDLCPTAAIVAPYKVDARRCISYLTIEHSGSIPLEFRSLMGNRIYGCDDCQLACPWNKFAQPTQIQDFSVRHHLDASSLVALFAWSAQEFDERMAGSAIRRIGHERWQRNLAVAMGNALKGSEASTAIKAALTKRLQDQLNPPSAMLREHLQWALAQA
jgi:epoxyqueuosine reductase